MPTVRRTFYAPPELNVKVDPPQEFFLAKLNNRVIGPYVNNHVIYGLKKKGRAEVLLEHGCKVIFEVVTPKLKPQDVEMEPVNEEPQFNI